MQYHFKIMANQYRTLMIINNYYLVDNINDCWNYIENSFIKIFEYLRYNGVQFCEIN